MYKQDPPAPGFMPPPPPYSQGPPPPQHAHHHHQAPGPSVVILQAPSLGSEPTTMTCPYCAATISTRVEREPTMKTHMMALLLCIFGCWPCAPCVYCADSCLGAQHYCPNCQKFLGQYDN